MPEQKIVIPGQESVDTPDNVVNNNLPDLTPEEVAAKEAEAAEAKRLADEKAANDDSGNDGDDKLISIDDKEYKLNDNGDALNEDGTVFKTKDELDKLSSTSDDDTIDQIEIDGVVYSIDKDGNAIDDKNTIVYTKDELSKFEEDNENEIGITVKDIAEHTKLNIYDSDGNPVEFENTPEGIEKYVESVYNKAKVETKDEVINGLYTAYPWLPDLINHVQLGGDLSDFNKEEDYDSIKLDKENENQLKNIIFTARSKRGDSADSIDRYYNYLKDSDTDNDLVFEEAQRELKYLSDTTKEAKQAREAAIQQTKLQEQEQINKYWGVQVDEQGKLVDLGVDNSVYNIIKSKKLKLGDDTFQIPDKIRVVENGKANLYTPDDFFTYLYEPITVEIDGKRVVTTRDNLKLTQEQQRRNVNNDLYDAFMRFVNYDKSQFIKEQVKANEVKRIKKLSSKKLNSTSNTINRKSTNKKRVVIK